MADIHLSWLVSATLSVLSTKYLLSEDYPFPYHLLLFHLAGTVTLKCVRYCVREVPQERQDVEDNLDEPSSNRDRSRQAHRGIYIVLYAICASASLVCAYQALLHWPNLASLSMLLSLSWRPECQLSPVDTDQPRALNLVVFLRRGLVALGISAILLCDLKLVGVGIVMALLSIGFGAMAELFYFYVDDSVGQSPGEVKTTTDKHLEYVLEFSPPICALCSTALLLWLYEGPEHQSFTTSYPDYLALAINIVASAWAINASNALFRPSLPRSSPAILTSTIHLSDLSSRKIALSFVFAAVVSTGALTIPRSPSGISIWQYAGYSLATIALLEDGKAVEDTSAAPDATHTLLDVQSPTRSPKWHTNATDEEIGNCRIIKLSRITTNSWALIATATVCWLIVLGRPLVEATAASKPPANLLDLNYKSISAFDMVVAQYNEPIEGLTRRLQSLINLPNIQGLMPRIIIYDKLENRNAVSLAAELQSRISGSSDIIVSHLENVGREGDTYLHHIVSRWDDLASHTLFIQAEMHHPRASMRRIQDYLRPNTGFLSLQNEGELCGSLHNCHDRYWSEDPATLFSSFGPFDDDVGSRNVALTYKGQFIASAARIRGNGVHVYGTLLEQLRDLNSSLHAPVYVDSMWHRGQHDSLNAPIFGFTLERMWGAYLQCSPLRIALKCPTLISGMLRLISTVIPEDCQCIDE